MSLAFKLLFCTAWALSGLLCGAEAVVGCGPSLEAGICTGSDNACSISTAAKAECKSRAKCLEWCHSRAQVALSQVTCCEFTSPSKGEASGEECFGDDAKPANYHHTDYGSCYLFNRPHYVKPIPRPRYVKPGSAGTKSAAACSTGCSIGGGSCTAPGQNCAVGLDSCMKPLNWHLIKTSPADQVFNACCLSSDVGVLLGSSSVNECLASAAKTVGKTMVTQTQWDAAEAEAVFQAPTTPLINCHCQWDDVGGGRCGPFTGGRWWPGYATVMARTALCGSIGMTDPKVSPRRLDCQVCAGTHLCSEAFGVLQSSLSSRKSLEVYGVCTGQHPANANGKCSSACVQQLNCALGACKNQAATLWLISDTMGVDFSNGASVTAFLKALQENYKSDQDGRGSTYSMAQGCQSMFANYDHSAEHVCITPFVSYGKQTSSSSSTLDATTGATAGATVSASVSAAGMYGSAGLSLALLAALVIIA